MLGRVVNKSWVNKEKLLVRQQLVASSIQPLIAFSTEALPTHLRKQLKSPRQSLGLFIGRKQSSPVIHKTLLIPHQFAQVEALRSGFEAGKIISDYERFVFVLP